MIEEKYLRYPIGKFEDQDYVQAPFNAELRDSLLIELKMVPSSLEMVIQNLDSDQLQTPYRPGGWTVNQVIHHVADSHMNAYTRCKLALTESNPEIKTYDQEKWALLPDNQLPVNISITLLHALHQRWYALLNELDSGQWKRTFHHPEQKKNYSVWDLLKLYVWHGKHHVAHIHQLRIRNHW